MSNWNQSILIIADGLDNSKVFARGGGNGADRQEAWMTLDVSHSAVKLMMPVDSSWSATTIASVFVMWAMMMVAMMLPSAAPMILSFDRISRQRPDETASRLDVAVFVAAYLVAWLACSALATGLQWGLQRFGLLTPMITSRSVWLTSSIFIVAGLYQFSPLKQACLGRCRTPLIFLMREWRAGLPGAWAPHAWRSYISCRWPLGRPGRACPPTAAERANVDSRGFPER